jgi:hypothetical protein
MNKSTFYGLGFQQVMTAKIIRKATAKIRMITTTLKRSFWRRRV